MIEKGDGSFQAALDDGRCPKCTTKYVEDKFGVCVACNLVVDSKTWSGNIKDDTSQTKEADMYETRLVPTEEEIVADSSRSEITWNAAVGKIQSIIHEHLYDPEPVDSEYEAEVLEAWKRIMRG